LLTNALPDTGAASGDYVNEETAAWLDRHGGVRQKCSGQICSGIGDTMCTECMGQYVVEVTLANDLIKESLKFKVLVKVVKSTYPIILGRQTLKENQISLKCFKYFTGMTSVEALLEHVKVPTFGVTSYTKVVNAMADRPRLTEVVAGEMRRGRIFKKEELLTPAPDEEYVDPKEDDVTPWETNILRNSVGAVRPEVFGDDVLKASINALVNEYTDIFRSDLNPEAARLPPMKFDVDEAKWQTSSNRERIRNSSISNQKEIREQVAKLQEAGVIQLDPEARYYSQVLLAPKPDGTWRFCIDFRKLNLCLKDLMWPIPNIEHLIRRLGKERSEYFAKFDMSKGYWQILIDESTGIR
jgi:hypothetical protein